MHAINVIETSTRNVIGNEFFLLSISSTIHGMILQNKN